MRRPWIDNVGASFGVAGRRLHRGHGGYRLIGLAVSLLALSGCAATMAGQPPGAIVSITSVWHPPAGAMPAPLPISFGVYDYRGLIATYQGERMDPQVVLDRARDDDALELGQLPDASEKVTRRLRIVLPDHDRLRLVLPRACRVSPMRSTSTWKACGSTSTCWHTP